MAEGGGLLNRYRVVKPYRGFESLRLRHPSPFGLRVAGPPGDRVQTEGRMVSPEAPKERSGDRRHAWYVYFLELSNGDIYVGSTDDLRRRVASHQQGHVISTSKYLPLILRSYAAVGDEATARSLERYFKSGSGKAFAQKRFLAASEWRADRPLPYPLRHLRRCWIVSCGWKNSGRHRPRNTQRSAA